MGCLPSTVYYFIRSRHELTHTTDNENGVQSLLWLFGKPRFALQFNFEGGNNLWI
jgi:hypothetical protein